MSVMLELSCGTMVIDLFTDECPLACTNFLKLCKLKYYNNNLIFHVQRNFIARTGDPTGTGQGGNSVFGILSKQPRKFFSTEVVRSRKMDRKGLLCMVSPYPDMNASQFFITLRGKDLEYLDGKHTIFGQVVEGFDTLKKLNDVYCDEHHRPYYDIRILHTYVLDDPMVDPLNFQPVDASPESFKPTDEKVAERIPYGQEVKHGADGRSKEEIEEAIRKEEARSRAEVLEMIGDLPSADVKPPSNVLFVCKLNPVTQDEDLEIIFSKYGEVKSCEVIRDRETGESLQYAFVEFATDEECERAYFKMNNVVVDDRRIKVDFSQSVAHIWNKWAMQRRGMVKDKLEYNSTRAASKPNSSHSSSPLVRRKRSRSYTDSDSDSESSSSVVDRKSSSSSKKRKHKKRKERSKGKRHRKKHKKRYN